MKSLLPILLAASACLGCDEPPSALVSVDDPTVDPPRAPGAPFQPGERIDVGDADAAFDLHDPSRQEFFGEVIAPGDLDGDGLEDLLVVSTEASAASVVPCEAGCPAFERALVHVVYGDTEIARGDDLVSAATIAGWYVHDLRFRVRAAGDVDGDGRADVLVGIGTGGCEQGQAFVIYGGSRLSGERDVRELGAMIRERGGCTGFGAVSGLGDVDADGLDDFGVGAPAGDPARLYVYRGGARPAERLDESAALTSLVGAGSFGYAEPAGDVDGDGHADFFVAARAGSHLEHLRLVLGAGVADPAREPRVVALPGGARAVAGVGDLNADGRDDVALVVGAREAAREVLLFLDADGRADALVAEDAAATLLLPPGPESEWAPVSLGAGDVDGDGLVDLLIGDASYAGRGGDARGIVHLVRGGEGVFRGRIALAETTSFVGQLWLDDADGRVRGVDALGSSLATPDLDGDGIDDLVLSAPGSSDGGRVHVWLGRPR